MRTSFTLPSPRMEAHFDDEESPLEDGASTCGTVPSTASISLRIRNNKPINSANDIHPPRPDAKIPRLLSPTSRKIVPAVPDPSQPLESDAHQAVAGVSRHFYGEAPGEGGGPPLENHPTTPDVAPRRRQVIATDTAVSALDYPPPLDAPVWNGTQTGVNGDVPLQQLSHNEPSHFHSRKRSRPKSRTHSRSYQYCSLTKPRRLAGSRFESTRFLHSPSRSASRTSTANSYLLTWQTDKAPVKLKDHVELFVTDVLPRQVYLLFLFRLPALYFLRVTRVFEEADLTLAEIKRMVLHVYAEDTYPEAINLYPACQKLITAWELLINKLVKEWETLNVVSVLLLPAIVALFQIQGAAEDPVTRYIAFWSLICALMSLLYGCLFIIYFPTMRQAHKAAKCAIEAIGTPMILWNVWVMLAMPAVWMSWSIVTFVVCIMTFMWRTNARLPTDYEFSVAPATECGFRIFICIVLGTGVAYGILTIITLKRYGTWTENAWERGVQAFARRASECDQLETCSGEDLEAGSMISPNSHLWNSPLVSSPRPSRGHSRQWSRHRESTSRSRSHSRIPFNSRDLDRGRVISRRSSNGSRTPSSHSSSPRQWRHVPTSRLPIPVQGREEGRGRRGRRYSSSRHKSSNCTSPGETNPPGDYL